MTSKAKKRLVKFDTPAGPIFFRRMKLNEFDSILKKGFMEHMLDPAERAYLLKNNDGDWRQIAGVALMRGKRLENNKRVAMLNDVAYKLMRYMLEKRLVRLGREEVNLAKKIQQEEETDPRRKQMNPKRYFMFRLALPRVVSREGIGDEVVGDHAVEGDGEIMYNPLRMLFMQKVGEHLRR